MDDDAKVGSLLAVLGGACIGSYTVFLKKPAVIRAGVHPIVFLCFKVAVLVVYNLSIVARRASSGAQPLIELNWLGVASGLMWVPAGLGTISCVPLAGVSACALTVSCVASVTSFGVGLTLGERVKSHDHVGVTIYYAPLYVLGICLGMATLVLAPRHFAAREVRVHPNPDHPPGSANVGSRAVGQPVTSPCESARLLGSCRRVCAGTRCGRV